MGLLSTLNLASATEELNLSFNIILINLTSHCGNKWRPTKREQAKSLYTEVALTRESDTVSLHSAFYRGSKAGRGAGELYGRKKGRKASGVPWLEAVSLGKVQAFRSGATYVVG